MIVRVNEGNLQEYEEFITKHPKGIFMHSSKWGRVKSSWQREAVMCKNDNGDVVGAAAVLIRRMPVVKYSLMYCCRGFVCDEDDYNTFDELFEALLKIGKEYKAFCLKIDPEIVVSNAEYKNYLISKGFVEINPGCKDFENEQPRFVYCFDYNDMNEEELMLTFKSDYRTRIRKAPKKGVEVRICGKEYLDDFIEIMKETGERDGFNIRPKAYFEGLLDGMTDDVRLYMAFYEGKPIAGTLAVKWGKNVMVYLYGASSNAHRNVYPNYALQWEMIKWGMECGCKIYDFGGISGDCENPDNPHYGLWRFKHGFGGYMKEYIGEFDYIINKPVYKLFGLVRSILK